MRLSFAKKDRRSPLRSAKSLKFALFLILVGALLYYVTAHWRDFAAMVNLKSAEPVASVSSSQGEDFFVEFTLEREKMQKEQIDLVRRVMDDEKADKDVRKAAYQQYLALVDIMGKELKIEGILKAKGLESIAFLSGDSCTVVVKSQNLTENDVAQIGDVVKRVSRIRLENVTVVPALR